MCSAGLYPVDAVSSHTVNSLISWLHYVTIADPHWVAEEFPIEDEVRGQVTDTSSATTERTAASRQGCAPARAGDSPEHPRFATALLTLDKPLHYHGPVFAFVKLTACSKLSQLQHYLNLTRPNPSPNLSPATPRLGI